MTATAGITDTGKLVTAEDVRDFLLANDHIYGMGLIEALKFRVGFYEAIQAKNTVVSESPVEPEPESDPEPSPDPEPEKAEEDTDPTDPLPETDSESEPNPAA